MKLWVGDVEIILVLESMDLWLVPSVALIRQVDGAEGGRYQVLLMTMVFYFAQTLIRERQKSSTLQ